MVLGPSERLERGMCQAASSWRWVMVPYHMTLPSFPNSKYRVDNSLVIIVLFYCLVTIYGGKNVKIYACQPRKQSSRVKYGAHLGPLGPIWAPRWPHELCYQGNPGIVGYGFALRSYKPDCFDPSSKIENRCTVNILCYQPQPEWNTVTLLLSWVGANAAKARRPMPGKIQ